jgi:HPt (histidine-containing phosphotransfer) domain-containing protein/two-component sensor histidine kinase
MKKLLGHVVLPAHVSAFEANYLARLNRIGFIFFALHLPIFTIVAYLNDTGPLMAVLLTSLVLVGPMLALKVLDNPRSVSLVYGFTAMIMGGLLVHFGQGPVQIEMHFYFFALLAMLAVFGNPMAIVVAAVTVAVHHLTIWMYLPKSVFNYDAPIWVVAIHAGFVVVESVATCFIARSFFDNVIGLEKIVQARTAALDQRNQDMRLVLDNVGQGFMTIDRDMVIAKERSRVIDTWLGVPHEGMSLVEYMALKAPKFAAAFRLAFVEVLEGIMPIEVTIDQLPKAFSTGRQHFRVECMPVLQGEQLDKAVLVLTDITAEVDRTRLEAEQRDVLNVLSRMARDKAGVLEFFEEARAIVVGLDDPALAQRDQQKRMIHTLKGNAMMFGVQTIGELCHRLESNIDETNELPTEEEREELRLRWAKLCESIETLLGERSQAKVEIDDEEYEAILHAVLQGEPHAKVARMIEAWKLEPSKQRLSRVAEQAKNMAKRLNKGSIQVGIQDHDILLDPQEWGPFWSSFVHVVRNAIDHGLEAPEQRAAAGKTLKGSLQLSTRMEGDELLIEIHDDGRGIDWAAVAEKARTRGIPAETQQDLVEALFADGLSTKSDVTDFSGRGVGMSAMRGAAEARGGRIHVESEPGGGTRVEFRFPRGGSAENDQKSNKATS